MADEKKTPKKKKDAEEASEPVAEETVSAPDGPVAPAAPVEEEPVADEQPVQCPEDCIRRNDRLMRKEDERQQELLRVRYGVTADCEVIGEPRLVARRPQQRNGK